MNIPQDRIRARTRAGSPNRDKINNPWHPLLQQIFAEQDRQRLTTTEFARRSGYSVSLISNSRSGETRPSMATAIALAETLGLEFVVQRKGTE